MRAGCVRMDSMIKWLAGNIRPFCIKTNAAQLRNTCKSIKMGETIMKRALLLIPLLALTACLPATVTLPPVDTVVALTMAALPAADTLTPAPSDTPLPPTASPTPTQPTDINPDAPGASCIPDNTQRDIGIVTRVIDGGTFEVAISDVSYTVKYIGLQAPAVNPAIEWHGPQSLAANDNLISGRSVVLIKDVSDNDALGALLRYVFVDGVFVNYELIQQGHAQALPVTPDLTCETTFLAAGAEARSASLGMWSPTPFPSATITPIPTNTSPPPPPTKTLVPVCDCSLRYTCNDFATHADAQACYLYCTALNFNIGLVDKNGNGLVCEGLP